MRKPVKRPEFGPGGDQIRSRKGRVDTLAAMTFNIPLPAAEQEEGFLVVEATALRDRLDPGMSATDGDNPNSTPVSEVPMESETPTPPANPAADLPTLYRWNTLQDSTLKGLRRSERWDVVTNYRSGDQIDAPDSILSTEISEASGSIRRLNPGQIHAKGVLGDDFLPNTAVAFLYAGPNKALQQGVFLVLNDSRPGYQHRTDALIFLEGFSFGASGGDNGATQVGNVITFWQPSAPAPVAEQQQPV